MRLSETKRADWSGLEETGRIAGVSFSRESWIRSARVLALEETKDLFVSKQGVGVPMSDKMVWWAVREAARRAGSHPKDWSTHVPAFIRDGVAGGRN
jgi:hypothetical protein